MEKLPQLLGAVGNHVAAGVLRLHAPVPCIVEGDDLRCGFLAAAFPEQHVVGGVGVERRIEIDQVDAIGVHLSQDVEVISEVQPVLLFLPYWLILTRHGARTIFTCLLEYSGGCGVTPILVTVLRRTIAQMN